MRGDVFTHILGRIGERHSVSVAIVSIALRCVRFYFVQVSVSFAFCSIRWICFVVGIGVGIGVVPLWARQKGSA